MLQLNGLALAPGHSQAQLRQAVCRVLHCPPAAITCSENSPPLHRCAEKTDGEIHL